MSKQQQQQQSLCLCLCLCICLCIWWPLVAPAKSGVVADTATTPAATIATATANAAIVTTATTATTTTTAATKTTETTSIAGTASNNHDNNNNNNNNNNSNTSSASASASSSSPSRPPRVYPAFFIFGDSLVDAGNNNYIVSVAHANKLPFGIDFPRGPTGRFCNGKMVLDVIAELLDLPFPPPYLAPTTKGKAVLQGVNYASGAGGYIRSTGFNFVGRVDFDTQIQWFNNTVQQLHEMLGPVEATKLVSGSIIISVMGSNDYVNNYLLSYAPDSKTYTPSQFRDLLLQKIPGQVKQIYELGGRTIVISGLGPLGCIPSQLVRQKSVNGECSEYVNNMVRDFNTGLQAVLKELDAKYTDAKIVYSDSFTPVLDYVHNPAKYGFKYASKGCCGAGRYNGQFLCFPFVKPCPNRKDYIWWDAFHPTEATNELLGRFLYDTTSPLLN